jgi:hypothetical protein
MRSFKEYIKEGVMRQIPPNKSKAKDLFEESERKRNSLNKIIKLIGISDENANDILEYCYDTVLYLIRSKLYLEGFKSSGEGAHEAEISYLLDIGFSGSDAKTMDELRYFRNGIKYYGKRFSKDYAIKIVGLMNRLVEVLKEMIKKSI